MRIVWLGWRDAYETLSVPALVDGNRVVWSGGYYYGLPDQLPAAREELVLAAAAFGVTGYDFSSAGYLDWGLEDRRRCA